jgi:putative long chain acyl-CoA synthase
MLKHGRLGAPYRAPFTVEVETPTFRLRHYTPPAGSPPVSGRPLLLVPPLMVTSEIYDISPELSAVAWLGQRATDVWVVDFGAPEREEGGLMRTFDDHVLAVDAAIDHILDQTGQSVHLGGYSQGGMFVYQTAAFRRSEGLASIITFGSPVDIHRNLPAVSSSVAERLLRGVRDAVERPLQNVEGLPGALTSTGFKVLSAKKEVQQFFELFGILHDRDKLEQRDRRRRFLGGEGFVAWPGPAFRTFVDEFVVSNRMVDGGFVVADRTVTLDDITCPVLYVVGERDEIARPASVRAVTRAITRAPLHELPVRAGHFGLVVGSTSLRVTWPTVAGWLAWQDGAGEIPALLAPAEEREPRELREADEAFEDVDLDLDDVYDVATHALEEVWHRVGAASREVAEWVDVVRWQVPRMAKLKQVDDATVVSLGKALREQAEAIPDATFFLWSGRAFSYAQADARVDAVVHGLWSIGVRPASRVLVCMENRPSMLSVIAAISRLGAVAALVPPALASTAAASLVHAARAQCVVADPEHASAFVGGHDAPVYSLGGGSGDRPVIDGVRDLEHIDPRDIALPGDLALDVGLGGDLALLVLSGTDAERPRFARVTNRRWAIAALATAAGVRLTSADTVYCCLPLHHPTGLLIGAGGALVGGARLALAPAFDATRFWADVRRYGASTVFYLGDMLRELLDAPARPSDTQHPVRVLAGTRMSAPVHEALVKRFGIERVVSFYASTESNFALVNLVGDKPGSVGRPLPGSPALALVRYDAHGLLRDEQGALVRCAPGEEGVLLARLEASPLGQFDGYAASDQTAAATVRSPFGDDAVWFVTGDAFYVDEAGDYFLVEHR